eukprot:316612-Chlamydomonas_euryale.AAC.2
MPSQSVWKACRHNLFGKHALTICLESTPSQSVWSARRHKLRLFLFVVQVRLRREADSELCRATKVEASLSKAVRMLEHRGVEIQSLKAAIKVRLRGVVCRRGHVHNCFTCVAAMVRDLAPEWCCPSSELSTHVSCHPSIYCRANCGHICNWQRQRRDGAGVGHTLTQQEAALELFKGVCGV